MWRSFKCLAVEYVLKCTYHSLLLAWSLAHRQGKCSGLDVASLILRLRAQDRPEMQRTLRLGIRLTSPWNSTVWDGVCIGWGFEKIDANFGFRFTTALTFCLLLGK